MITFIHTADIHFGMENYGKIDPKTGIHSRLIDFQNALSECIDRAISEQVDFFMFSGDAYKTPNPSPTHQRLLAECFLKLFKHHIPIVMVIGNHDHPLTFGKAHALEIFGQLPLEGFHVISKPENIILQESDHGHDYVKLLDFGIAEFAFGLSFKLNFILRHLDINNCR